MGQYFRIVFLDANENIIRTFVCPWSYDNGVKIMEHAYNDSEVIKIVEHLLSPDGMCYKTRLVWAGDYAEPDQEEGENLYNKTHNMANLNKQYDRSPNIQQTYRYILNHTKQTYIDKRKGESEIHPLPLLTVESDCNYTGTNMELVGTWARSVISMSNTIPDGYTELNCEFREW